MIEHARAFTLTPGEVPATVEVTEEPDLLACLARVVGVDVLRVVPTGGDERQRAQEQWDDANNVVALEPGVVVAYRKNVLTNAGLRAGGGGGPRDRGTGDREGAGRRPLPHLPAAARPRPDPAPPEAGAPEAATVWPAPRPRGRPSPGEGPCRT